MRIDSARFYSVVALLSFTATCSMLLFSTALGAGPLAGGTRRAKPPKFSESAVEMFAGDARAKLVGPRPAAAAGSAIVSAAGETPEQGPSAVSPTNAAGGGWSKFISSDTIEDEIKSLQAEVNQTVTTPSKFKGGGNKDAMLEFTILSVMFAAIADYDGDVRWKASAPSMRDAFARAGSNCKVGTDAAYNESKLRKADLEELVGGGSPQVKIQGDAPAPFRPAIMRRLEIAQQQHVSTAMSNSGEFSKNAAKVAHEAEMIAALAEQITKPGYEESADDSFVGFARTMRDQAVVVAAAAREKNYEAARKATAVIEKTCTTCHESYRSS